MSNNIINELPIKNNFYDNDKYKNRQLTQNFFIVAGFVKAKVVNKLDPSRFYLTLDFEEAYSPLFVSNLELTGSSKNDDTLTETYEINDFKLNDFFYCVCYTKKVGSKLRQIPLIHLNYARYFLIFSRFVFNSDFLRLHYFRESILFWNLDLTNSYNVVINKKQKIFYLFRNLISNLYTVFVNLNVLQSSMSILHEFQYCFNVFLLPLQNKAEWLKQILLLSKDVLLCLYSFFLFFFNYYIKFYLNKMLVCFRDLFIALFKKAQTSLLNKFGYNFLNLMSERVKYKMAFYTLTGWQFQIFDRYKLWRMSFINGTKVLLSNFSKERWLAEQFVWLVNGFKKSYNNFCALLVFQSYNLFVVFDLFFFFFNLCCVFFIFCFGSYRVVQSHVCAFSDNLLSFNLKKTNNLLYQIFKLPVFNVKIIVSFF